MAIELVPFDDLKTLLGLSKTESDYPDLTLIQESVVDMFEDHLDRSLELDTYTETKFVNDCPIRMIKLQALPVVSVTTITSDGTALTDYKLKPWGLELGAPVNDVAVQVTYVGGIEDVPGNIKRAALLQTAYEFQNKESIGIETVTSDGGTVTKPELGMLKEVKKLLNKFRHPYPTL